MEFVSYFFSFCLGKKRYRVRNHAFLVEEKKKVKKIMVYAIIIISLSKAWKVLPLPNEM